MSCIFSHFLHNAPAVPCGAKVHELKTSRGLYLRCTWAHSQGCASHHHTVSLFFFVIQNCQYTKGVKKLGVVAASRTGGLHRRIDPLTLHLRSPAVPCGPLRSPAVHLTHLLYTCGSLRCIANKLVRNEMVRRCGI